MTVLITIICLILAGIFMTNKDKSLHGIGTIILLIGMIFCGIAAAQYGG